MIRHFFILLLIPLYLAATCRTIFPFLEYAVNYQYVVANLCENRDKPAVHCNGQCHLKKNVKQQEEREQRDGSRERLTVVDWACLVAPTDITLVGRQQPPDIQADPFATLFRSGTPPFHPPRA